MRTLTLKHASQNELRDALARPVRDLAGFRDKVRPIIKTVREQGDRAIRAFTKTFDGAVIDCLRVADEELATALASLPGVLSCSLKKAKDRIERFHAPKRYEAAIMTTPGCPCWREVRPLDSVGLYVPGGTAPLFSTALMLGVPARLAGVERIVLASPPGRDGRVSAPILAVCSLLGIREVYAMGGVQAIAAMAYGTQTVAKVSKIVGPGNAYVAAAKAEVSIDPDGAAIDMLAGPSELLVVADSRANPLWVAADLLAQAEHDERSQVILVTDCSVLLQAALVELTAQLNSIPRRQIAEAALKNSSAILVDDVTQAIEIANRYAPEHLSIQVNEPRRLLPSIRNAGSVFIGPFSAGTIGDYCSGTNHVLPTSGAAKSQSGISVTTFQKIITMQELSEQDLDRLAGTASTLARAEGLEAHARAVEIRFANDAISHSEPETESENGKSNPDGPAIPPHIAALEPYESARALLKGSGWTFLDANESAFAALSSQISLSALNRYPDPFADRLREAISGHYGLDRDHIIMANGSDELIDLAVRAFVRPGRSVLGADITYGMYRVSAAASGFPYRVLAVNEDHQIDERSLGHAHDSDVLFLCCPNNPTGTVLESRAIERIVRTFPGLVVIDEAYGEFADAQGIPSSIGLVANGAPNVLVLRTFSKAFGAAGLRLGYGISSVFLIKTLQKIKPPYNVSALSQAIGLELWEKRSRMEENVERLSLEKARLMDACVELGCKVRRSPTNFFLIELASQSQRDRTYEVLRDEYRIVVRKIRGLANVLRITVGTPKENDYLISSLRAARESCLSGS
jgi:histidinol-phosphate aminotransferase